MTRARRGGGGRGGRPTRREIPGLGLGARPGGDQLAAHAPAAPAHDHAHWHFWRLTQDGPAVDVVRRQVPVDLWYALDRFATSAEAAEAAAGDAVARYPDAKRLKALADFLAAAPTHGAAMFVYKHRTLWVQWGLLGCDGQCTTTTTAHGAAMREALARVIAKAQEGNP